MVIIHRLLFVPKERWQKLVGNITALTVIFNITPLNNVTFFVLMIIQNVV